VANCLIKNLYEIDSLPHIKIHTKISQLSPEILITGGKNEVNGERKLFAMSLDEYFISGI